MVQLPWNGKQTHRLNSRLQMKCDHRVWPWPWPWPWIFKVKYRIGYISAKNGVIATKRKANISNDLKTSNVTIRFNLGHYLDLEFSRLNMELAILYLPKMVRLPRNEKLIYWLNSMPQMWPSDLTLAVTLTLNFQGQILNLLYLNQMWSNCHETKSKHIDLSSRPQMWQWVWPWPWPWYLNFKVICEVRCKDLPDSDRGDFSCRRAVDSSSSFHISAPAHEHSVLAQHRHGHSYGGLPMLFWVSIGFLIVIFHLFLFKLIFNEYCNFGSDKYYSGRARYSV